MLTGELRLSAALPCTGWGAVEVGAAQEAAWLWTACSTLSLPRLCWCLTDVDCTLILHLHCRLVPSAHPIIARPHPPSWLHFKKEYVVVLCYLSMAPQSEFLFLALGI